MSSARDFFSHYRKTRSRFLPRQWLHLASAIGSPVAADAACDWWEAVLGTKFCAACARVGDVACGLGGVVFSECAAGGWGISYAVDYAECCIWLSSHCS